MNRLKCAKFDDCYRTCLAMMLGFDDPLQVPHFSDIHLNSPVDGQPVDLAREWLFHRGFSLGTIPFHGDITFDEMLTASHPMFGTAPLMIIGLNDFMICHAVVVREGRVYCNPAPGSHDTPLCRPFKASDEEGGGSYWIVEFLVPLT